MYDSLLIDQSMALNRRCDDEKDVKTEVSSKVPSSELISLLSMWMAKFDSLHKETESCEKSIINFELYDVNH